MASVSGTLSSEPLDQTSPDNPPAPTYGQDFRDLPEQLVEILRSTLVEFQGQNKYARRKEVRRDRKLRFYEAGIQHLQFSESGYFTQMAGSGIVSNAAGTGTMQCPTYMDAYNIFLRFFLIIQAVLTQTIPPVRWQPMDPSNPDDLDKTKEAQNYAKLFDRYNDLKDLLGQIVRMLAMSGRTVSWTRTEQDAQRFGYEADGVTPKRFQRTTIHGTLETKVPITSREFDRTCPYALIFDDPDIRIAKDDYEWKKDQIKAGAAALGESNYERFARLGLLNGSRGQSQVGDSLTHVVSIVHAFMRPAVFTGAAFDVPMEDKPQTTVKDELLSIFPQGCRVVFVGDVYVAAFAECMDDHIDIQFPYQGDGLSRQGFMEVMAIVQDNFNDLCNWIREKVDTGAGETYTNGTQDDVDAITSRRAAPNAVVAAKSLKMAGEPMANSFYKTPDPAIPDTLFKLLEFHRGDLPEFLLAALPSLQGGDMSDNGTASGYAMATANAKGQLGILWSRMQRMFARIRYQSALAAAQDEQTNGVVSIQGSDNGETVSVDYDALRKGNFGCYPDEDSGFPETTASKRLIMEKLMGMAGQNPAIAALLDNPDNIEQLKELDGFGDLVFIPAEARTKQMFEIKKLLQEAPVPPDPMVVEQMQIEHAGQALAGQVAGAAPMPFVPPPNQPSVPVEELDFHAFEFAKCQEWLTSKARRDEESKGNSAGVQNIILHAKAHQVYMQAAAAAQAALAAPPSGKGEASPPSEKKPTPGTQVPQAA